MTRVVEVTRGQLLERRRAILQRYDVTLERIAERAHQFALVGDEWAAWDELQEIAFLLGEDEESGSSYGPGGAGQPVCG